MNKLSLLTFQDKQIYVDLNQEVIFTFIKMKIIYSQCTGFRYIQVFDHLKHKPSASFLDDSFTIFLN